MATYPQLVTDFQDFALSKLRYGVCVISQKKTRVLLVEEQLQLCETTIHVWLLKRAVNYR